ncbi:MAG: hypothetical protein ACJA2S_002882 [Cyclobacteriaceae bacterium]
MFNPPKGRSIELPVPADGQLFDSVKTLNGGEVILVHNESGVRLTVVFPEVWDEIDTIIELK